MPCSICSDRLDDGSKAPGIGVFVIKAFREDLDGVNAEVEATRQALQEAAIPMTAVRMLEFAIWAAVEPRGYYRN